MKKAFCNKNDGHLIVLLSVKMNSKQILFGKLFLTEVDLKHFMISEHINCQTYISKVAIAVVLNKLEGSSCGKNSCYSTIIILEVFQKKLYFSK